MNYKNNGQSEIGMRILDNHYEWCKKEGRDISWHKKYRKKQNNLTFNKKYDKR